MGTWDEISAYLWLYRLPDAQGQTSTYAYAVRLGRDGPDGPRWDAMVVGGQGTDDQAIRESVSLDGAKRAIEQHAAAHAAGP